MLANCARRIIPAPVMLPRRSGGLPTISCLVGAPPGLLPRERGMQLVGAPAFVKDQPHPRSVKGLVHVQLSRSSR